MDGNSNSSSDSSGFIEDPATITSSNYYNKNTTDQENNLVKYTSSLTYRMINNNTSLQINLNTILYKKTNASLIYFRIGFPTEMSNQYSFSDVSLSLLP